ncbi:hypothetical protein PR202_gb08682 [Eleusine coracana subsp. coracana]|uniref:Uncharacterized protein n=1 Tax=Eleusine coracana subsp. coracana TaxID=191504 RepID=A0AAV5EF93_ELECO|nr:hypothetical protein PR202_gb08682 [Eleusine coracana subsp. coracana]
MYTGIDQHKNQVQNMAYRQPHEPLRPVPLREWIKLRYNTVISPGHGFNAEHLRDLTPDHRLVRSRRAAAAAGGQQGG